MLNDFRIRSFPTYYILNSQKQVTYRTVGYSTNLGMRWNLARVFNKDFDSYLIKINTVKYKERDHEFKTSENFIIVPNQFNIAISYC